jgi:hypothetical protein
MQLRQPLQRFFDDFQTESVFADRNYLIDQGIRNLCKGDDIYRCRALVKRSRIARRTQAGPHDRLARHDEQTPDTWLE